MLREALSGLEKLDAQINALLRSVQDGRKRVEAIVAARVSSERARDQARAESDKVQLQIKNTELVLSAVEQEIDKLKKQRLQITSEKSLQSLEQSLKNLEEKKARLEEDWLLASEESENVRRLKEHAEQVFRDSAAEQEIEAVNQGLREARRELQELQSKRSSFFAELGSDWTGRYEKLRQRFPEKRVIFELDSEFCPGCNMQINHRVYERLRYNGDVLCCSSCGSIIFWPLRESGNA